MLSVKILAQGTKKWQKTVMENKVFFIQWPIDKWRYVRFIRFHAPFTRLPNAAEIIYSLPYSLEPEIVKQIDDFVLKAIHEYDSDATIYGDILNTDEQKDMLIHKYSHCKNTTFIIYNNPDSADVMDSFEKGRTEWWSFRTSFNVYVSPYVDDVDFQIYENSGSFLTYPLVDEHITESLLKTIWDNAGKIEDL